MSSPALPLADARAFRRPARRTAAACAALAFVAAGALALVYGALRSPQQVAPVSHGGGVVPVVDVSGSISSSGYQVVRRTLERIAAAGGPVGLVLFSDAAEEALPPGTPARELRPYLYALRPQTGQLAAATLDGAGLTPWDASFSRGTRISAGLALAHRMLGATGGGRVVLLSDLLDDPGDAPGLRHQLLGFARDPAVRLQVVRLPGPGAAYLTSYRRVLGGSAVGAGRLPQAAAPRPRPALRLWVLVLIGALGVALAAAELGTVPLTWRRGT